MKNSKNKEINFPQPKYEKSAIKAANEKCYNWILKVIQDDLSTTQQEIRLFGIEPLLNNLYEARYLALCMHNGCEGTKAAQKFWSLVKKAEKAILKFI
ncbi:MAG: hypothetical protein EOM87_03235 [Clostridia bacterium]|nr:hypothetical protein [Clostridia bacterium]